MADVTAVSGQTPPPPGSLAVTQTVAAGFAQPHDLRQFGNYELLSELGRGGMGIVYKARQRNLDRLVAIKMILSGRFAGQREVQRFRAEAEAAAALDHPHIVPIYEVGQHEGWHFYTMKLIEGHNLAQQMPRFRDDPRCPARLLVYVARAIHHAHQRGILHRDIKPSNILLDAQEQPFVADLGLAKHLDRDAHLTRSDAVMGTPAYMAPEQASGHSGDATTACDVYSLGAVLYEMVAGHPPFQADSAEEMLRQVREREAPSLRTMNTRADRDLETICLKCLSKDPMRRYESAAALADDLERWLRQEPIHARPASLGDQVVKFVRRHRALMAGLLTLVLVLIGGIITTTWQAIRARDAERGMKRERNEAIIARGVAEENRARAEQRMKEVWQFAQALLFDVHDAFEKKGPTAARERLTQVALTRLDSLVVELGAQGRQDPAMLTALAAALQKVGDVQGHPGNPNLGNTTAAIATYQRAVKTLEPLLSADPENVLVQQSHFQLQGKIADLLARQGRYPESVVHYRDALARGEAVLRRTGDSTLQLELLRIRYHIDSLVTEDHEQQKVVQQALRLQHAIKRLADASPGHLETRRYLRDAYGTLCKSQLAVHDRQGGLNSAEQEFKVAEDLAQADSQNAAHVTGKALALRHLGDAVADAALSSPRDAERALEFHHQSMTLLQKLVEKDTRDVNALRELIGGHEVVGALLDGLKRPDEARAFLDSGIRLAMMRLDADPNDAVARGHLRSFFDQIAVQQLMQQDFDEAIQWHRKAIEAARALVALDRDHVDHRLALVSSLQRYGLTLLAKDQYRSTGETTEGVRQLEESVRLAATLVEQAKGSRPGMAHNLAVSYYTLGNGYLVLVSRRPTEAVQMELYRKARDCFSAGVNVIDTFRAQRPDFPRDYYPPPNLRQILSDAAGFCERAMQNPGEVQFKQPKLDPPPP